MATRLGMLAAGGAPPPRGPGGHPNIDATVWTQSAAERRAVVRGIYAAAERALEPALADASWTAALEQQPPFGDKPPAVILDVDETVLENAPFQAGLVRENRPFEREQWNRWIRAAAAEALPGARAFLRRCGELGVAVFYVTNRHASLEAPTRENLRRIGFPALDEPDGLLMLQEKPGWNRDKSSRRAQVAATHRVLLLLGDDLADFLGGVAEPGVTAEARRRQAEAHARDWGVRWFAMPNPTYGSWKSALWHFESGLSRSEQLQREHEALVPFDFDAGSW